MRLALNPVLDIATLTWVANDGTYDYDGPFLALKVSAEAKANEQAQTRFYQQMTAEQTQMFGAQVDLLDKIKAVTMPILAKGPQQYGFTAEEDALLRGEITDRGAQATANVVNATQLRERQKAGGANILPSGADAQLEEQARILGAQDTAGRLAQEKLSGYQYGHQLYAEALSALSGVGGLQNPVGYAGAASGAGREATGAVNLADSERSNILGKLLGGALGGVTGGLVGDLGTAVSKVGSGNWGW